MVLVSLGAAHRVLLLACLVVAAAAARPLNLYQELGVESDATRAQIREAYRKLALQLHPDKKPNGRGSGADFTETTARFIRVSEAYATLSNEKKRAAYDATLRRDHASFDRGQPQPFAFRFSLKDALDVLESLVDGGLGPHYAALKVALQRWSGFELPLPELLATGALAAAAELVDWSALGSAAKKALTQTFQNDDGSVNWLKVGAAAAAGSVAVASALDSADDGNRTATLIDMGGKALSWLANMMGDGAGHARGGGGGRGGAPDEL